MPIRRVVVTGLGAITPLGVGIQRTWSRLLNSECGIISVADRKPAHHWDKLPSTIAGIVPSGEKESGGWQAMDWLVRGDERRMAKFAQYSIAATEMALNDAGWQPQTHEEKEMTGVCLGSGIGNLEELYNTSLSFEASVRPKMFPVTKYVHLT